jgi:hypothetical protein
MAVLDSVTETSPRPIEIFISYSHKDDKLREDLVKHLSPLQNEGLIKSWHDRKITAGEEWAGQIDDHLMTSDIILLLVSKEFMSSKYCYDIELRQAMARHEASTACVIPVILQPVYWRLGKFSKLQALPLDGKPIVTWGNSDDAFLNVVEGIKAAVDTLHSVAAHHSVSEPGQKSGEPPPPSPAKLTPTSPSPHEQQTSSVNRGLEALADFMRTDPAVRDEVVKFQSDFNGVRDRLNKLQDYKSLHDLLHNLQVQCVNGMLSDVRQFPDDAEASGRLVDYSRGLDELVEQLEQVTSSASFPREELTWLPSVKESQQLITEGLDDNDAAKLQSALRLLRRVLDMQPPRIDKRLTAKADDLRLDRLVEAMTTIRDRVVHRGLDPTKFSEFEKGARDLDDLNVNLKGLVVDHSRWQDADMQIRQIQGRPLQDIQDIDDWVGYWQYLHDLMQPLYKDRTDSWAERLRKEAEKLDAAIQVRDLAKIRQSFGRYRGDANQRFHAADKDLKTLCDELRDVGDRLDSMLNLLKANR